MTKLGFSETSLSHITGVMQGFIDRGEAAGLNLLIARRGVPVYEACLGLADIEAGKPMTPETIFRIYSMSKPVTVVATLILYERGYFSLDDPVSRFLPAFGEQKVLAPDPAAQPGTIPAGRAVTLRHLLTMTSGIPYPGQGSEIERIYQQAFDQAEAGGKDVSLAETVDLIASLPLAFTPGTQWLYGLSHDVLGRVVEVVSGKALDRFLAEEIFAPLGMADTGFFVPKEKTMRLAAAYGPGENGPLTLKDSPKNSRYLKPPPCLSGGGGLVSTIGDYARFAGMLLYGGEYGGVRILGRRTVRLMTADHLGAGLAGWEIPGYTYGLGVRVMKDPAAAGFGGSVGEFGWAGYASTWFCVDPAADLVAILMAQYIPDGTYPYAERFRNMLYAALEE